jgi:hypothetical protein
MGAWVWSAKRPSRSVAQSTRRLLRLQWVPAAVIAAGVCAAPASAVPPAKKPAPAAHRAPAVKPGPPRPTISLTAMTAEARRAQIRLAMFIQAVQSGQWARAATYLSRQVGPAERQQLIAGTWLRRTSRRDFSVLLYMTRIEIRTVSFRGTNARLRILPLTWEHKRGQPFGVYDVPMVRENNRWTLNIHPETRAARAR